MEYLELIRQRHSVRSFRKVDVEDDKLKKILEAGILAPTAANRQPFRIIVIKNPGHENILKKIYSREWFYNAPLAIGICSIPDEAWVRSDKKKYSDVDCAIAMDHMVLAAADMGLGTCWIGAFNPDAAKEILNLDKGLEPIAFTPVGYPEAHEYKKIRKPMDEIVKFL